MKKWRENEEIKDKIQGKIEWTKIIWEANSKEVLNTKNQTEINEWGSEKWKKLKFEPKFKTDWRSLAFYAVDFKTLKTIEPSIKIL